MQDSGVFVHVKKKRKEAGIGQRKEIIGHTGRVSSSRPCVDYTPASVSV